MLCRVCRKASIQRLPGVDAAAFSPVLTFFRAAFTAVLRCAAVLLLTWQAVSCRTTRPSAESGGMEYAQWFDLQGDRAVILSPYGGAPDTIKVDAPVRSIVCMSSSYIGFLDALGCDSVATAVSGLAYVSDPEVRAHAVDVGYDAALDYETILKLRPDLVLTYAVSAAEPPYLQKLRDLGIPTAVIHEHLESHPLARAEYIKFFGLLTGRTALADSLFADVRDRYLSLVKETDAPKKILVNIPYADQWYIPGGDNYMTRLIQDAGGAVLGAVPGRFESTVISVDRRPIAGSTPAGAPPRPSSAASTRSSPISPSSGSPSGTIRNRLPRAAATLSGKPAPPGRTSYSKTSAPSSTARRSRGITFSKWNRFPVKPGMTRVRTTSRPTWWPGRRVRRPWRDGSGIPCVRAGTAA